MDRRACPISRLRAMVGVASHCHTISIRDPYAGWTTFKNNLHGTNPTSKGFTMVVLTHANAMNARVLLFSTRSMPTPWHLASNLCFSKHASLSSLHLPTRVPTTAPLWPSLVARVRFTWPSPHPTHVPSAHMAHHHGVPSEVNSRVNLAPPSSSTAIRRVARTSPSRLHRISSFRRSPSVV